ncbi:MAG: hypothetical protein IJD18_02710, partial [Clostridia bacterium]|nr:hypothetical protein [Clostridia bacterium]
TQSPLRVFFVATASTHLHIAKRLATTCAKQLAHHREPRNVPLPPLCPTTASQKVRFCHHGVAF